MPSYGFGVSQIRRLQLQIISIRRDAAAQRSQAAKFNTPATFAQCAKHERKAGALEKQAEALQKQQVQLYPSLPWILAS